MRKILLSLALSVSVIGSISAQVETWLTIGIEDSNFYEHANSEAGVVDSIMKSIGATLKAYSFWNEKNIGIFIHDSFAFPYEIKLSANGETITYALDTYEWIIQIGLITGPAFRYNVTKDFKIYGGIGLSYLQTTASRDSFSMIAFNLGVGGDVGIKYDVTDECFLSLGVVGHYDLKNYTIITTSYGSASGWADSAYRMFSFRPYAGFGFNTFKKDTSLGKPK